MARKLAAQRKWAFNWRKIETRGVGHSAPGMFAAKEVKLALFGATMQRCRTGIRHLLRSGPRMARLHRPHTSRNLSHFPP